MMSVAAERRPNPATVLYLQPPSPFRHPDRSEAKGRDLLCALRSTQFYRSPPLSFVILSLSKGRVTITSLGLSTRR